MGTLQILPCTVSQLLSATEVDNSFRIGNCQVMQVSCVGVVRSVLPSASYILYSVDDMTGPPLDVKEWLDTEEPVVGQTFASAGTYVKVSGHLQNIRGRRSLVALNIRCLEDPNELTSHMLEVVQANIQLFGTFFGKMSDGSSNSPASTTDDTLTRGLSSTSRQVLNVIQRCHISEGIGFQDLTGMLEDLNMIVIRECLKFLLQEGHIYTTIDVQHFKSV